MDCDTQNVVKELAKLQVVARELERAFEDLEVVARELVQAVEGLEGVEIPYRTARLLAATSDAVLVVLGEESKLVSFAAR